MDSDDVIAEHHPVGFGNENWILYGTARSRYVLKIGDHASAGDLDGRLARIFVWIDGTTASAVESGSAQSTRLMHSTGAAVRALHSVGRDVFSSRLDDSSPAFASWKSYVDHRLTEIRARCEQANAVEAVVLDRACSLAAELASDVDHVAEAVLLGWGRDALGMVLDGTIDWVEVAELLVESFCALAPKKLIALLGRT